MNKAAFPILVVSITLAVTGLAACSGGGSTSTVPQITRATQTPEKPIGTIPSTSSATTNPPTISASRPPVVTNAPPAGVSASWSDMPAYSGANEVQKGTWAIPATHGGYGQSEWHYYQSKDSLDKVAPSLRSQMAANGWPEAGWFDVPGQMSWGSFTKNGDTNAAMVWVSTDGTSGTVIALWRASK